MLCQRVCVDFVVGTAHMHRLTFKLYYPWTLHKYIALCFIQPASQNDQGGKNHETVLPVVIFKSLWTKFCAFMDFHHIYFKSILFHSDSEHHLVKMNFILPPLHHPSTLLQFLGTPWPIHGHRAPTLKYFTEAWRPAWESRVGWACVNYFHAAPWGEFCFGHLKT